jgi:hypothetical protein
VVFSLLVFRAEFYFDLLSPASAAFLAHLIFHDLVVVGNGVHHESPVYALFFIFCLYFGPPLWSSGQSSWLQIRRPGFDSQQYQKKKVLCLEWGPLSLVSTTEELLDRNVAAPVKKTENTAVEIRHAGHVASSIRKS